jgi:transposase-like protein
VKPAKKPLTLRAQQKLIVAEKVAALLAEGVTQAEICRTIGMASNTLYRLMDDHPEIMKKIHQDVRHRATLSRHRVLTRLEEILEQDENPFAALRAGEAIDKRAGMTFEQAESGVTVQIFGESVKVGDYGAGDLRALAMEMAGRLGPDFEKVIDAEFSLQSSREGKDGDEGGAPEGASQDRPDGAEPEA